MGGAMWTAVWVTAWVTVCGWHYVACGVGDDVGDGFVGDGALIMTSRTPSTTLSMTPFP